MQSGEIGNQTSESVPKQSFRSTAASPLSGPMTMPPPKKNRIARFAGISAARTIRHGKSPIIFFS